MVALLRVLSILHIAVCMPEIWLAGNTEHLAQYIFGTVSMGRTVDMLLEEAFIKISSDGALLLDEDFIVNIFSDIVDEVEPFEKYLNSCSTKNPVTLWAQGIVTIKFNLTNYYVKNFSIQLGRTCSKRTTLPVSWPVKRQQYSSWSYAIQQKRPANTYPVSLGPRVGATHQLRPSQCC